MHQNSTASMDQGSTAVGRWERHALAALPSQHYLRYLPGSHRAGETPLVFIHGYSRQVEAQVQALLPICEARGCALIAPIFDREHHPRYQQLGRSRHGLRAYRVLDACLQEGLNWQAGEPFLLLGFSGGAQFAHRYALAYPQQVARLIAVAAGWYTMPEEHTPFPRGLCTRRRLRDHALNPEYFLRVPTTVIVGGADTGGINLRRGPALDAQQGHTRVERARRWVCSMREAAQRYGMETRVSYREVPGQGHDFNSFVSRNGLLLLIEEALGPRQEQDTAESNSGKPPTGQTTRTALAPRTEHSVVLRASSPGKDARNTGRFITHTGGLTLGFA